MKRARKLETRYEYLRRDARVLTAMCELAAKRLHEISRGIDGGIHRYQEVARAVDEKLVPDPSELRELSSEFARLAYACGRGPGAKTR
jgi:hypothetical protein